MTVPTFKEQLSAVPSEAGRPRILAAVRAYLGHEYADVEGRAGYYAENAILEDPAGAPPVRGRQAIVETFRSTVARGLRSQVDVHKLIVSGDEAMALCRAFVTVRGEPYLDIELVMCMRFDGEAKIISTKAYFDADSVTVLGAVP